MVTIQEYIANQQETIDNKDLALKLQVSISMISLYKKSYNPSLDVAKRVYIADGITLHPFAEESLKYEINKDN